MVGFGTMCGLDISLGKGTHVLSKWYFTRWRLDLVRLLACACCHAKGSYCMLYFHMMISDSARFVIFSECHFVIGYPVLASNHMRSHHKQDYKEQSLC